MFCIFPFSKMLTYCCQHKSKKGGEMGAWLRSVGIGSQATPCHITALQLWNHIYKSSTSTQPLTPAEKLNEDSLEALPGTSLSAVQYSTVRDTTDRVGLSHTGCSSARHDCASPCRATNTHNVLYRNLEGDWWFQLRCSLLPMCTQSSVLWISM